MRSLTCLAVGLLMVVGVSLPSVGCGGASHHDRCQSSSGMPQGEMPCYEPPPNSTQREKKEEQHAPPGNPMPSH